MSRCRRRDLTAEENVLLAEERGGKREERSGEEAKAFDDELEEKVSDFTFDFVRFGALDGGCGCAKVQNASSGPSSIAQRPIFPVPICALFCTLVDVDLYDEVAPKMAQTKSFHTKTAMKCTRT